MFYSAKKSKEVSKMYGSSNQSVKTEIVNMSPEFASILLNKNDSNRNIRKNHVQMLSGMMKRGEWVLSPQGVIVHSASGRLLDGQHRLSAVVAAGVSVPMMIFYTEDEGIFKVLDQGVKRSTGDIFSVHPNVADTVNYCCRVMLNAFSGLTPQQVEPVLNSRVGVLAQELVDFCPTVRRGLSSSPMKAAVVTSVIFGEDKDYVFNLYKNLVLLNYEGLPPIGSAFMRQLQTGSVDFSKSNGAKNTYVRALKLFDADNRDNKVIRLNNDSVSSIVTAKGKALKSHLISVGSLSYDWGRY